MASIEEIMSAKDSQMIDIQPLPEGHELRFEAKMRRHSRRRLISYAASFVSVAAAVVVAVLLFTRKDDEMIEKDFFAGVERNPASIYDSFLKQVKKEYTRMASLSHDSSSDWEDTFRMVTSENIPMVELLPEDMPEQQKADILADYYQTLLESMFQADTRYCETLADNSLFDF